MVIKNTIIGVILGSVFATSAMAQEIVKAPIVHKNPSYTWQQELVGYDTQCKEVYINQKQGSWSDGPSGVMQGDGEALAGGIIGGVIGNQFGGGSGKDVMTVLGAIVGSNMAKGTHKNQGGTVKRTVCDEVPVYERVKNINGYQVTYSYGGRHYQAWFQEDPGTHVTLELHTTHSVRK